MVTLMAPLGFSGGGGGGHLIWFIFFFLSPRLSFLIPNPRDRKMTVTTDKLVRCLVGDVL